jgi:hypothetical protein
MYDAMPGRCGIESCRREDLAAQTHGELERGVDDGSIEKAESLAMMPSAEVCAAWVETVTSLAALQNDTCSIPVDMVTAYLSAYNRTPTNSSTVLA